jgi:hypothetical protein
MENTFASYEGISACWIEKCTFISGIVAIALSVPTQRQAIKKAARRRPESREKPDRKHGTYLINFYYYVHGKFDIGT